MKTFNEFIEEAKQQGTIMAPQKVLKEKLENRGLILARFMPQQIKKLLEALVKDMVKRKLK